MGRRGPTWLCVRVGLVFEQSPPTNSSYTLRSFGLLHRIPPLPDDRQPGILPLELQDSTGFEEQNLYVPADATTDQFDFDFHTDTRDQHQPIFSPPHSHDYSYSYSNRSAAHDRQLPSSTIPEEYEETERYSSRSSQDSDNNHHYGHDHSHHNHHIGTVPTSNLGAPDVNSNGDSRS